jgi:putative transposase
MARRRRFSNVWGEPSGLMPQRSHASKVSCLIGYLLSFTYAKLNRFVRAIRERTVMTMHRRQHRAEFKAKVALEAIRGERTINELAAESGVHPWHLTQRKKGALEALPRCCPADGDRAQGGRSAEGGILSAYWAAESRAGLAEKKLAIFVEEKRRLIEPGHPQVSLRRQCALQGLSRWSLYYQPGRESVENLQLMRWLDEQYTATPFYGIRRMTAWLRSRGYAGNHERVRRLLRTMALEAIDARLRLS